MRLDVVLIDADLLRFVVVRLVKHVLEQVFEHRMQTPCAEVLAVLVFVIRRPRDLAYGFVAELKRHAVHAEQSLVLLEYGVVGFGEDLDEIVL